MDHVAPYAEILGQMHRSYSYREFRSLKEPVDRHFFEASVTMVNAFYHNVMLAVMLPAAKLQSPFFDQRHPLAMNYALMGMPIGHELMQAFDSTGSMFNENGAQAMRWDASMRMKYESRSKCLSAQYSRFSVVDENGKKVNDDGKKSLAENFADNAGFEASLMVRFFINTVQEIIRH